MALFLGGMPIASLKYKRERASEGSLACYIQEAVAAVVWNAIDPQTALGLRSPLLTTPPFFRPRRLAHGLECYPERQPRGFVTGFSESLALRSSSQRLLAIAQSRENRLATRS